MNTEYINQNLNQIKTALNQAHLNAQEALDKTVKLSYDRQYSNVVQDVFDDTLVQFSNDIKSNLRDNITTNVGSENEDCIAPDGSDLSYLNHHPEIRYAHMDDVQSPITRQEASELIDHVKSSVEDEATE